MLKRGIGIRYLEMFTYDIMVTSNVFGLTISNLLTMMPLREYGYGVPQDQAKRMLLGIISEILYMLSLRTNGSMGTMAKTLSYLMTWIILVWHITSRYGQIDGGVRVRSKEAQ
ncbi:MAG: hypothetical protein [Cressdnaviricota sp.]|nr:MAG: hypothetical protein [Cressdnaviricota sp.]